MRRPNRNIEIFSMSVLDLFASALGGFIMIAVILFPSYLADQKRMVEIDKLEKTVSEKEKALADKDKALADKDKKLTEKDGELAKKGEELDNANNSLAEAAVLKAKMDDEVEALRLEIARTFLIVSIEWDTVGADVDLSITDPGGRKYYFARNNRNGKDFPALPVAPAAGSDATTPPATVAPATPETPAANANWAELSFDNRTGPGLELWQAPLAAPGEYMITYTLYGTQAGSPAVEVKGKLFYRNGRTELPVEELTNGRSAATIKLKVTEEGTLEIL